RTPGLLAWLRLVRVFQKVDRASTESLRYRQLSPAQLDVLAKVGSTEGISQQELADALLVTKGNVCQLLDKMEGSGLLERRPDGRVNRLFLTDQGRRVHTWQQRSTTPISTPARIWSRVGRAGSIAFRNCRSPRACKRWPTPACRVVRPCSRRLVAISVVRWVALPSARRSTTRSYRTAFST